MLQAPVVGFRRGRGVLDSRNPLSITLPMANDLWREADVVISVGSRMFFQLNNWGVDKDMKFIRIDADPDEADRTVKANVSLVGDSAPILRALLKALPAHNEKRKSRKAEMEERHAQYRKRIAKLVPQMAILDVIRAELPEDGIFVDEVTQIGFAARLAMPFYKPRTFLSPGYQDNLGWGFATALGAQDARRDVPVLSISGDGGFLYTATELSSAVRHKIPLVTVVFNNNAFGNVKLIQQEWYGGRTIASDLTNPDFVKLAESFGAASERVETPAQLRAALRRGFKRRGGPTVIEMTVGPMPSPWEFIFLPRVRG
jgi:acetolactate synthase-1/2/3 large subunit